MCACAFARVASQHTFVTTNSGFSPPHITFVDANAVLAVSKVALRFPNCSPRAGLVRGSIEYGEELMANVIEVEEPGSAIAFGIRLCKQIWQSKSDSQ